jgi:DNA processing protein
MTATTGLPVDQRFAAALASLGASPGKLRQFLTDFSPPDAWEALATGRHPADRDGHYRASASPGAVERVEAACVSAAVAVRVLGSPQYPPSLATDFQAPAVLFTSGDPAVLEAKPRVAVVGTRGATPYGLGLASELGRGLARADVVVVSGLAAGIDAAAHGGVLGCDGPGPPVGVLGAAHDAAGPRTHVALRASVAQRGALFSEIPPGVPSARWWFAVRNRVMAALAHVVVVVECHSKGGSLHTVSAAVKRNVTVAAYPGSVRSAASFGTNALLADGGAQLVRGVEDVVSAVDLAIAGHPEVHPPRRPRPEDPLRKGRPVSGGQPNEKAVRVRRALDHDPASIDTVVRRCGLPLGDVALALEQLLAIDLAEESHGWWCLPRS